MSSEQDIIKYPSCKSDKIDVFENIELTSDELIQTYSRAGKKFFMYMLLKDVSSIQLCSKSFPVFIVIGILIQIFLPFALKYTVQSFQSFLIGFIFLVLFVFVFFMTRKNILLITACGGEKMVAVIKGSYNSDKFINEVTQAKKNVK